MWWGWGGDWTSAGTGRRTGEGTGGGERPGERGRGASSLSLTYHPQPHASLRHHRTKHTSATPAAAGRFQWGWPVPWSYPYTRGPWLTYGPRAGLGARAGYNTGPLGG